MPRLPVGTVDLLDHLVEGHGVRVVAQPLEGIAVGLGQKIGAVRRQLADLHIGGPEGLEHLDGPLGSKPAQHVVLAHDVDNLVHALVGGLVLQGNLGNL